MFSQLGPLFKTTFRQAENTDTRQGIRRDEKKDGKQKNQRDQKDRPSAHLWEDSTDVSVSALKAFLENFLNAMPDNNESNQEDKIEAATNPAPEPLQPKTTIAARAVKAYGSMSEKTAPAPSFDKAQTKEVPGVDSEDVRTMYKLIEDLEMLESKGLKTLHIQRADTFLSSLAQAVRHAKSKL